jgi:cytochrome P450
MLRRLVSRGFAPKSIAQLEPRVRELARANLDGIEPGRTVDAVHDMAAHVPAAIICEMVGIPRSDHLTLASDVEACGAFDLTDEDRNAGTTPPRRVFDYLLDFVADRRKNPGEDMISIISASQPGEESLSEEDVAKFAFLLLIGGTENVRATISRGLELFAHHPGQLALLRREPELMPRAIEEVTRMSSTAAITGRTFTAEFAIENNEMQVGQRALLCNLAANHDEDEFGPDARAFRIDRQPNRHLALGTGIHVCIGAPLARLEMRVFFEELLSTFTSWQVGVGVPIRNFEMFRAYDTLPAEFAR